MKKFIVAVVYTGKSKQLVHSRWYKIEASTKSVAASRALAKAQADNPRYSAYSATVDTLSARKIKWFNREFNYARWLMGICNLEVIRNTRDAQEEISRLINREIRQDDGWLKMTLRGLKRSKKVAAKYEATWLQMLELHDVING